MKPSPTPPREPIATDITPHTLTSDVQAFLQKDTFEKGYTHNFYHFESVVLPLFASVLETARQTTDASFVAITEDRPAKFSTLTEEFHFLTSNSYYDIPGIWDDIEALEPPVFYVTKGLESLVMEMDEEVDSKFIRGTYTSGRYRWSYTIQYLNRVGNKKYYAKFNYFEDVDGAWKP